MISARRNRGYTALKIEGGILPPEYLHTIATLKAPHQDRSDYGLSESLEIKEEISRSWQIASKLHKRYAERGSKRDLSATQDDWPVELLRSSFGYNDLTTAESITRENRAFRLTHRVCDGAVPLLFLTPDFGLDKSDPRLGYDGGRQAPYNMMQEFLNTDDTALWGMVSNGSKLRILRENLSLTRSTYIEVDLDLLFAEELYPDFAALWLSAHASRLRPFTDKPSNCIMEVWRKEAHKTGERVREKLRDGVTNSINQLGNGFLRHPSNVKLREYLVNGKLSPEDYFQQLLRLIYRLLFLLTTEERNLLHTPEATDVQRTVYAEGYSLSRLREYALHHRYYDHHQDLWLSLQIIFRMLAEDTTGLGLSALGGLFRSDQCSVLDGAAIANRYLLEAVRTLAYFRSDRSLARVNYRDMDTEELGSVYESLLELHPIIDVNNWNFFFAGNDHNIRGSKRKLTGSYYTPPSLVSEIIRSTLEPVIQQAIVSSPDNASAAILALKVIDPACGSGHFLLAAARRLAEEIARIQSVDGTLNENSRQHALREVMQHCIYGVDKNSLSVELCKTALWIETIEPGKPLTFLDSHILQGDSLIGILDPDIMADGIPSSAYDQLTGDNETICRSLKKNNRQPNQQDLFDQDAIPEVAVESIDLDNMPEETLDDIEHKRTKWQTKILEQAYARETLRANLFVGTYFTAKTKETFETVPRTLDIQRLQSNKPLRSGVKKLVGDLSIEHDFLHWHLAFNEIMRDGGFHVILGNPPWEVSQLNEKEYFATMVPSVANLEGDLRKRKIAQLKNTDPKLWSEYQSSLRGFNARNKYCRKSGRYSLSTFGKLNSYALFAETFLQLLNPRGRAGLIVPTGIATDDSTKVFFDHIVSRQRLVSLYDFENREAIFPEVHRQFKFCLLTLSGQANPVATAEFAFFLHQTDQLKDYTRRLTLGMEDIALFNPNTRTCPIFRTQRDMDIARKLYKRAGVFWKEAKSGETDDNPWGVSFMQMFNMTSDSNLFWTRQQLEDSGWMLHGNIFVKENERYLPLYEAKLFYQYDHRFATFDGVSEQQIRNGNARPMTIDEKSDTSSLITPRYWVSEKDLADRLNYDLTATQSFTSMGGGQECAPHAQRTGSQLALRLITNSTNKRTELLAMIPRVALGHTAAVMFLGYFRTEILAQRLVEKQQVFPFYNGPLQ